MIKDNIVKTAHKHGLTIKQERFAQAVASGSNLVSAARQVGYELTSYAPSLGSRMVRNEKISNRIAQLIAEQDFESHVKNHWVEVLTAEVPNGLKPAQAAQLRIKQWEAKDRVIQAIAKLGGWEPSKVDESRKLIIKGDIRDMLPSDGTREDGTGESIVS